MAVRLTEAPPGIEDAEDAVLELQRELGAPPQVASPARLDAIGLAALRLERALGQAGASPFTAAMKAATGTLDALVAEIEGTYRVELV